MGSGFRTLLVVPDDEALEAYFVFALVPHLEAMIPPAWMCVAENNVAGIDHRASVCVLGGDRGEDQHLAPKHDRFQGGPSEVHLGVSPSRQDFPHHVEPPVRIHLPD